MKKSILFFGILILLINITLAQPITKIYTFPEGFNIIDSPQQSLILGQDYQYNFFLANQSNGALLNNNTINCSFFISNSTGRVIYLTNAVYNTTGYWRINIGGNNFTDLGLYNYGTKCTDGVFGAAISNTWTVTRMGLEQSEAQAIGSLAYLILMVFLMTFFGLIGLNLAKSSYLWVIGIFFLFLSTLFLVYNTYLGYEYHLLLTGMPNSRTPEIIFYIFMTLLLAGFLTTLALLFIHWKKVFRYIKREIKRKEDNYEDIEDWDYENWTKGHELNYGHFSPSGK